MSLSLMRRGILMKRKPRTVKCAGRSEGVPLGPALTTFSRIQLLMVDLHGSGRYSLCNSATAKGISVFTISI